LLPAVCTRVVCAMPGEGQSELAGRRRRGAAYVGTVLTTPGGDIYIEGDDFDDREFRRGVWRQTLTSVALVTVSAEGQDNVMACEWTSMVPHAPLCFTIPVPPRNATHDLLVAAGEFGLSFCSDTQAHLSHVSGSNSLHDGDKWQLADFPTYAAERIAAP